MLYTFLITIVFIAEIIITLTVIIALLKLDKAIIETDVLVSDIKPSLKDVLYLMKKISAQMIELAEDFEFNIKKQEEDTAVRFLNKTLIALILWKINSKAVTKIRRSKIFKTASKGFNLLKNMV